MVYHSHTATLSHTHTSQNGSLLDLTIICTSQRCNTPTPTHVSEVYCGVLLILQALVNESAVQCHNKDERWMLHMATVRHDKNWYGVLYIYSMYSHLVWRTQCVHVAWGDV